MVRNFDAEKMTHEFFELLAMNQSGHLQKCLNDASLPSQKCDPKLALGAKPLRDSSPMKTNALWPGQKQSARNLRLIKAARL